MKKFEGLRMPERWEDVTIRQFSKYNQVLVDFNEKVKDLDADGNETHVNQILIEEIRLNFDIIETLSGMEESDVYSIDVALAKEYVNELKFLVIPYEAKGIKSFYFKDVNYNLPDSIPLNTKFGQYVEALQAEMTTRYTDKDSVIYLAHQLAHMVDNGQDWDGAYRDKLAEEFKDLPASIGLDFSFFLSKKCQIYSLAYLQYVEGQRVKKLPFIKTILHHLGGLKHYMSWLKVKYSINLIKLQLTVFYIQIREMFFNIFHSSPQKVIMKHK